MNLARLVDPLGFLAPIVVGVLPEDLHATWTKFRNDLDSLNNFKISRHIFKGDLPAKTHLQIFSDVSENTFGAVAYIRAVLEDKRVIVQLLCAKARVVSLKQQTLPRLKLCAAVIFTDGL